MTKRMACIVLLSWAAAVSASAQSFTTLVDFSGTNGSQPFLGSLAQGADGNLYGTTFWGGSHNDGEVFRISTGGTLTKLYSFDDTGGAHPFSGLVLGEGGIFYGTTETGNTGSYLGTVFKISPKGVFTLLHNFDYVDGLDPNGQLVLGRDGNFYGTTPGGGANGNYGTVFKITPAGTLTTLYSFCSQAGCPEGYYPVAGLVLATDGSFYGTSYYGGITNSACSAGCGTIFKLTPLGSLTTLYSFCAQGGSCSDGATPWAGLVQGRDGNFYGTTPYGGADGDYGTAFKITPAGTLTTLHSFNLTDGATPYAALVQATDGNFYGTTSDGGANLGCNSSYNGCGTLFRITRDGVLTTLHSFDLIDGSNPDGGLLQHTDGSFFGTTSQGGNSENGTVFSLSMGFGPFLAFVRTEGRVAQTVGILGQGLTGTTAVTLNGTPASFAVLSDTFLEATVPAGATTGLVAVTTPSGTLTSNKVFRVIP